MDFESIKIYDIIPQRPPMVMIDRLLSCDQIVTSTALEVRSGNIFAEDGMLAAEGVLENIAQTCAARMGFFNLISETSVKLGFIGAVKNFTVTRLPRVGETLITTINVEQEVFNVTLVNASVCVGDETIASTTMKIALSDIDSQA